MAVVVANVATDPVTIFNYFHAFHPTESSYTRTATGVRVTLGPNEFTDFDGNFQYFGNVPIGGTLTAVKATKNGVLEFSATGLNLDVQTVYSYTSDQGGQGRELELMPIALAGHDTGTGSNFVDKLDGHNGNDRISGRDGNDVLNGMSGNDALFGDGGDDNILGDTGNDLLKGGLGIDRLNGGVGTDVLYGDAGNDIVVGGTGNDTIRGGNDNDILSGDTDNDIVFGDAGTDTVQGRSGDDTLNGGLGNDRLIGGVGNDKFVFNTAIPAKGVNTTNVDRIADFNVGNDTIQIDNAIFKGLACRRAYGRGLPARHPGDRRQRSDHLQPGDRRLFLRRQWKRRPVDRSGEVRASRQGRRRGLVPGGGAGGFVRDLTRGRDVVSLRQNFTPTPRRPVWIQAWMPSTLVKRRYSYSARTKKRGMIIMSTPPPADQP